MISVVIPLYNKEKSIASTLHSVYEQTYTDYEVVIVNDGSTDNSANVVKDFIAHIDDRWTLINQKNAGVSAARNSGILAAKGEYVAFLDADDLWAPDFLETFAALTQDYPNAGLYCVGYSAITNNQYKRGELPIVEEKKRIRGRIDNPWTNKYDVFAGSSNGGSRECLIRVGLFDTRMTHGEDLDLFWRLILDSGLVCDSKCCAFYRMDAENRAMHRVPPLDKLIVNYVDKYAEARANDAEFRKFFDEQMIYRLYPYMLSKTDRKEARKIAKQFDYSQLKWSMHFRMLFPWTYYYIKRVMRKM